MSFWGELKRRNVVKVGAAYVVVAWLLIQVTDIVLPTFSAPEWVARTFTFLLMLGFPVAVLLAWAYELTPEGIKRTKHVPLTESITHITGQKLNYIITGLVVLVLGFVVIDQYVLEESPGADAGAVASVSPAESGNSPSPAEQESPPQFLPNSVAVLPLDNLSPDPNNAYIAAGLHEEILNQLAKLSGLNVIARTSVLPYAANRPPIAEIAAALNVQSIVEGSVRYAGNRIRVTTQLIDSQTGSHLWSETYDREFDDIFAIESDIAMSVANALEAEFSDEEQQRIERPPTDSSVAYGVLLQAQSLVGLGQQSARINELLDQAIAIDPNFALAYGTKALVYATELINTTETSARSRAELEPLVREYADRALALDPATPSALTALAQLASVTWSWSEARDAFGRMDQFFDGTTGALAVWLTAWSGDEAEAISMAERWATLDPLSWTAHWAHGIALNYAGRHEAAVVKFRQGIALAPALSLQHSFLALSEAALGNADESRRELELAEQLLGENRSVISLLDIAYGYGRIGDSSNARRLFDEITAMAEQGQDIGAGGWALANLAVGNLDEALEWLEQGAEKSGRGEPDAGYFSLMNIRMNYTDDPALEEPRFADVRNRIRGD